MSPVVIYNNLFNDLLVWVVASELIDDSYSTVHPAWGSLFILFWLFFMFFKVNNLTSFLLIAEAAMVTIVFCYISTVPFLVQSLLADLLNVLNASAMEAIVGIVIVFSYHGSWKNKKNTDTAVIESNIFIYKTTYNGNKMDRFRVNCYGLKILCWYINRILSIKNINVIYKITFFTITMSLLITSYNFMITPFILSRTDNTVSNSIIFNANFMCYISELKYYPSGSILDTHINPVVQTRISNSVGNSQGIGIRQLLEYLNYNTGYYSDSVNVKKSQPLLYKIWNNTVDPHILQIKNDFTTHSVTKSAYQALGPSAESVSVLSTPLFRALGELKNIAINVLLSEIGASNRPQERVSRLKSLKINKHGKFHSVFVFNKGLLSDYRATGNSKIRPIIKKLNNDLQIYTYYLNVYPGFNKLNNLPLYNFISIIKSIFMKTTDLRCFRLEMAVFQPQNTIYRRLSNVHQVVPYIKTNTPSWSDKSFVAPLQSFSDLLPWYEESTTDNEILQSTDSTVQSVMYSSYWKTSHIFNNNNVGNLFDSDYSDSGIATTDKVSNIHNINYFNENTLYDALVNTSIRSTKLRRNTREYVLQQPRLQNLFGSNILSLTAPGIYSSKKQPITSQIDNISNLAKIVKSTQLIHQYVGIQAYSSTNRIISYAKSHSPNLTNDTLLSTGSENKNRIFNKSRRVKYEDNQVLKKVRKKSFHRGSKMTNKRTAHIDRAAELVNMRSIVKDRMFKPVDDILNSSFINLYINSAKISLSTIPPRSNPIKSLVSQASNIVHSIDARKYPLYTSTSKYSHHEMSAKSTSFGEKASVTSDDETDVEMVRVFSEKPNTIYGLVWDEFISNIYGNKLMFLSFDEHTTNNYTPPIKNDILNIRSNVSTKLDRIPDLRYNFSIHDEILFTVKNNLIAPTLGYRSRSNKNSNYGGFFRRRGRFRKLRSDLISHRKLRKISKVYFNRQHKYSDPFPSQLRSQTPHLVKLPYSKKYLTNLDYNIYRHSNNNISLDYNYNTKNNINHRLATRLDTAVPALNNLSDSSSRSQNNHISVVYGFNDFNDFNNISYDTILSANIATPEVLIRPRINIDELKRSVSRNIESTNEDMHDNLSIVRAVTPAFKIRKKKLFKNKTLPQLVSEINGNIARIGLIGEMVQPTSNTCESYQKYGSNARLFGSRGRSYSRFHNPIVQLSRSKVNYLENKIRSRNALTARRLFLDQSLATDSYFKAPVSKILDSSLLLNSKIFSDIHDDGQLTNRFEYVNSWSAQAALPKFEFSYLNIPTNQNNNELVSISTDTYWWDNNRRPEVLKIVNTSVPSKYYRGYYTLFDTSPWIVVSDNATDSYRQPASKLLSYNTNPRAQLSFYSKLSNNIFLGFYRIILKSCKFILLDLRNNVANIREWNFVGDYSNAIKTIITLRPLSIYIWSIEFTIKVIFKWAYAIQLH